MRPSKITPKIRRRLKEVADLKRRTPSYKDLELETGIHRAYLAKVVHELVHEALTIGPLEPGK